MFFAETLDGGAIRLTDSAQNVPNIAHFPQKSMIERSSDRVLAGRKLLGLSVGHFYGQSPVPGFAEKNFSNLPAWPSKSLASAGDSFFWVIFGQDFAYSALTSSHFSSPGSVSGLIASAGHSGSHTPQSIHSSGWITSMFSPS